MGCAVSRELQTPRKKQRTKLQDQLSEKTDSTKEIEYNVSAQNFEGNLTQLKAEASEQTETTTKDVQTLVHGSSSSTRTLSKRISDKVEYFEQLSRQNSEEPKLTKRNSAYSKWKVEDLPKRTVTAPLDRQHIARERNVANEGSGSSSTVEIFAEDAKVSQRVTSWRDVVQQLRSEYFVENYLLDKSLKRRSSKLGA